MGNTPYVFSIQGSGGHFLSSLIVRSKGYSVEDHYIYSKEYNEYLLKYERGNEKYLFDDGEWISNVWDEVPEYVPAPLHYIEQIQSHRDMSELWCIEPYETPDEYMLNLWYIKVFLGNSIDVNRFLYTFDLYPKYQITRFSDFCRFLKDTHPDIFPLSNVAREYFFTQEESDWSEEHFLNESKKSYKDFYQLLLKKRWYNSDLSKKDIIKASALAKHRGVPFYKVNYEQTFRNLKPSGTPIDDQINDHIKSYMEKNNELLDKFKPYITY